MQKYCDISFKLLYGIGEFAISIVQFFLLNKKEKEIFLPSGNQTERNKVSGRLF